MDKTLELKLLYEDLLCLHEEAIFNAGIWEEFYAVHKEEINEIRKKIGNFSL